MIWLKYALALIAVTLLYDNADRGAPRIAVYWGLVAVYWLANAAQR